MHDFKVLSYNARIDKYLLYCKEYGKHRKQYCVLVKCEQILSPGKVYTGKLEYNSKTLLARNIIKDDFPVFIVKCQPE